MTWSCWDYRQLSEGLSSDPNMNYHVSRWWGYNFLGRKEPAGWTHTLHILRRIGFRHFGLMVAIRGAVLRPQYEPPCLKMVVFWLPQKEGTYLGQRMRYKFYFEFNSDTNRGFCIMWMQQYSNSLAVLSTTCYEWKHAISIVYTCCWPMAALEFRNGK
jgi:hypothetical protein